MKAREYLGKLELFGRMNGHDILRGEDGGLYLAEVLMDPNPRTGKQPQLMLRKLQVGLIVEQD